MINKNNKSLKILLFMFTISIFAENLYGAKPRIIRPNYSQITGAENSFRPLFSFIPLFFARPRPSSKPTPKPSVSTPTSSLPEQAQGTPAVEAKKWALWNHANGDNNLAEFIDFNAENMAKASINDNMLVMIQADRPYDYGTYRYQIKKGKIDLVNHLSYEMGQNPGQEIIDGIQWLQDNYSFTHLILNLWGHGSGIEDPTLRRLRGILFDDTNNTYLTNQEFSHVVDSIKDKLGKNIDIIGTDACLMGAIEIGWQIKNSVDILVASETTEPGSGWDYAPFLNAIAKKPNISSDKVASEIVSAYGNYYRKGRSEYTLSAMDLQKLPAIAVELHKMIDQIKVCLATDARSVLVALMSARALSLQMDDNSYIDFSDFLTTFADQISRIRIRSFDEANADELASVKENLDIIVQDSRNVISDVVAYLPDTGLTRAFKDDLNHLAKTIDATNKAVKNSIIANVSGNGMNKAQGMTIYFPPIHSPIHESYPRTKFAQETRWMSDFLLNIMGYQIA